MQEKALDGILHKTEQDIQNALGTDEETLKKWNNLTPIQRNEWICWIITVKKAETRQNHIKRMLSELKEGKKTPCCWPGCPHRNPKLKKYFKEPKNAK